MKWSVWACSACLIGGLVLPAAAVAQGTTVYRCPGNPVLYTDSLSARDARDKGCRTLDGAPITVIQGPKPRLQATAAAGGGASSAGAASAPVERISPVLQRARDADRRAILEGEMHREEQLLTEMKREFNNGEPERRGDERNYQKYLDRVAELKAGIARKESDLAALKRELAKLPP